VVLLAHSIGTYMALHAVEAVEQDSSMLGPSIPPIIKVRGGTWSRVPRPAPAPA
jgi:esterase/lipase superfamily enzyme